MRSKVVLRTVRIWLVIAAAFAAGASPGLAGDGPQDPRSQGPANGAVVAHHLAAPLTAPAPQSPRPHLVQGGACADACRNQFNQCRVSTKGDPRCNSALTSCLQRCLAGKGR